MNSLTFSSSLVCPLTSKQPPLSYSHRQRAHSNCLNWYTRNQIHRPCYSAGFSSIQFHPSATHRSLVRATAPEEGTVAVMNFEELAEKDWSFLESDSSSSKEERNRKIDQLIAAGNIVENSKVLVSIGSEEFVDRLVNSSPCQLLLVVHESIITLACIKEMHDKVKCWQGELIFVPEKWAPVDVVFLYFLPALPFKLDDIFKTLSSRCSPGARVVISHLQGRQELEQQRKHYPDVVVSDLPEKIYLEKVTSDHSFQLKEFVDDSSFYLAVLEFNE